MLKQSSLAILVFALSYTAYADTIYNTQSSWSSAVSGTVTSDNFSGITLPAPPGNDLIYGTGPGATVTLSSVTYTAGPTTNSQDYLGILGVGLDGLTFTQPVLAVGGQPSGPADLIITLPYAVNALGFFVDTDNSTSDKVAFSDGTQTTEGVGYPGLAFVGITSTTGITSVEISNTLNGSSEQGLFISEVEYGPEASSTTPEPSSAIFLMLGMIPLLSAIIAKNALAARTRL